jgi:hypothetical protein
VFARHAECCEEGNESFAAQTQWFDQSNCRRRVIDRRPRGTGSSSPPAPRSSSGWYTNYGEHGDLDDFTGSWKLPFLVVFPLGLRSNPGRPMLRPPCDRSPPRPESKNDWVQELSQTLQATLPHSATCQSVHDQTASAPAESTIKEELAHIQTKPKLKPWDTFWATPTMCLTLAYPQSDQLSAPRAWNPPRAHRRPKIRLSWCAVPMHHDDPPVSSGVTMTMIDR